MKSLKYVLILVVLVMGMVYSLERKTGCLDLPYNEKGEYSTKDGTYAITLLENVGGRSPFLRHKAYNIAGCIPGNQAQGVIMINGTALVLQCNVDIGNLFFEFKFHKRGDL